MSLPKIELIPAASWVCDSCGKEHYVRVTVHEVGRESGKMIISHPPSVECTECGAKFEAEYTGYIGDVDLEDFGSGR